MHAGARRRLPPLRERVLLQRPAQRRLALRRQ
jgi:hypothetical protein